MNEKFHCQLSLLPAFGSSPALWLPWRAFARCTPSAVHQRGSEYCVVSTKAKSDSSCVTCGSTERVSQAVAGQSALQTSSQMPLWTSVDPPHFWVCWICVLLTTVCQRLKSETTFDSESGQTVWLCACLLLIFHFLATNATIMSNNKESGRVSTGT